MDYATDLKGRARQFGCGSVFLAKDMQAMGTATEEDTNLDPIEDSSERAKGDGDDDEEEAEEECEF